MEDMSLTDVNDMETKHATDTINGDAAYVPLNGDADEEEHGVTKNALGTINGVYVRVLFVGSFLGATDRLGATER